MPEKISILELDIKSEDIVTKLADITARMKELREASDLTAEQQEINKAQLKALIQEYQNTQKVLVALTQSENQELGTLQKLSIENKNLRTEQQKLNLTTVEGSKRNKEINVQINKNTAFIRKNSDAYVQQKMNIGNYRDALNSLPGPLGRIATKLVALGPAGAAVAAGIGLLSAPFIAFFASTERGMDMVKAKVEGFKLSMQVLKGEVIKFGDSMVPAQVKAIEWGTVTSKALRVVLSTAAFIPAVSKYLDGLEKSMNDASVAGEKLAKINEDISDAERAAILPREIANTQIKEARLIYADNTKTINERINALSTALELEKKTADDEIALQKKKTAAIIAANVEEIKATGQVSDAGDLKLQESLAKEESLRGESIGRQIRAAKSLQTARADLEKESTDILKAENSKKEQEWEQLMQAYSDDIDKELADIQKKKDDFVAWDLERIAIDQQNIRNLSLSFITGEFEIKQEQLNQEREIELEAAKTNGADIFIIHQRYANYQMALDKEVRDAKLQTLGDYVEKTGSILDSFYANDLIKLENKKNAELSIEGLTSEMKSKINEKYDKQKDAFERKQFNIAKIIGIAKATLNAYVAVSEVFAAEPGELITKSIAAGIALAEGLATVAKIRKVKIGSTDTDTGGGGSNISSGGAGSFSSVQKTPAQLSYAGSDVLMSRQNNPQTGILKNIQPQILVTDKVTAKQNADRLMIEAAIL